MTNLATLTLLGSKRTEYPTEYNPDLLESFESPTKGAQGMVISIECPEFTSLCPITAQPDFARIDIDYEPDKLCVESKSLKLYLFSFRNHGSFHEECVQRIFDDLWRLLSPNYLRVRGRFMPRGGISINPVVERYRVMGRDNA